ncbi:rhoptry protein ROP14, putative [Plasmodium chabaudi chabaudi]|uniref:Rhoptry protein ROP14, putative n=1 Tax=Plasmodium chabaudi chabaudi TaxID=31271 RepID=A0A4V0K070_PLACU|nr:rhoptry protein ROP14, putative [Plasmodium chabaudi chabaudi]VTZ66303.1 rhoptry protein ROP14, putative [Plasmodium chabaudi chabaudi]|eukprot:XP_016653026.1 rhoptry protein, putative [Plasmodium chabaudi chabaudi]
MDDDFRDPTKLMINSKEIEKVKAFSKIKRSINNIFKQIFCNDNDDSYIYKIKGIESTFWCSQIIYTRIVLLACFFSFFVSWKQNAALIGENGLTPAKEFVDSLFNELKNADLWTKIQKFHSLFWFIPTTDLAINLMAILGMVISAGALLFNCVNVISVLVIYILLQSIYSIGNVWFNYVFEIELLELVFLCLFIVPLNKNSLKSKYSTTFLMKYVCRFFVFKVLIGTSLIRFRNTDVWGKLEGKYYLYETQPLPTIVSYFFHTYEFLSKCDNLFCILCECVFSFFLLFPIRSFRIIGGTFIFFYCILNFINQNSYLFYFLLLAPLMYCFDDKILFHIFTKSKKNKIINVIMDKIKNKHKSRRYFKSFDIFYFMGMNEDEVYNMYDSYFNIDYINSQNGLTTNHKNHTEDSDDDKDEKESGEYDYNDEEKAFLKYGSSTKNEIHFYNKKNNKKRSFFQDFKKDIYNIYNWLFKQKGLNYILISYNISKDIFINIIGSLVIFLFNCLAVCLIKLYNNIDSSEDGLNMIISILFTTYFSILLTYAIYIFLFTKNYIAHFISQISLLLSTILIYSYKIFPDGFTDNYYSCLFLFQLFCLFILSTFYLNNKRFIYKYLSQYFYLLLFAHFIYLFGQNILSPDQVMNETINNFEFMNIYGSFGQINKTRHELIIQGTNSQEINDNTVWDNIEFNCKPDNNLKSLCFPIKLIYGFIPIIYIDRLDWHFSSLAYQNDENILEHKWFQKFLIKLMQNDKQINSLLYKNPFLYGDANNLETTISLQVLNAVYKFSHENGPEWWTVSSSETILDPEDILPDNPDAKNGKKTKPTTSLIFFNSKNGGKNGKKNQEKKKSGKKTNYKLRKNNRNAQTKHKRAISKNYSNTMKNNMKNNIKNSQALLDSQIKKEIKKYILLPQISKDKNVYLKNNTMVNNLNNISNQHLANLLKMPIASDFYNPMKNIKYYDHSGKFGINKKYKFYKPNIKNNNIEKNGNSLQQNQNDEIFGITDTLKKTLDNAINNSYTNFDSLNQYSDKMNKLGLLENYNNQNNFISNYIPQENIIKSLAQNNKNDNGVYLIETISESIDKDNTQKIA